VTWLCQGFQLDVLRPRSTASAENDIHVAGERLNIMRRVWIYDLGLNAAAPSNFDVIIQVRTKFSKFRLNSKQANGSSRRRSSFALVCRNLYTTLFHADLITTSGH